MPDITCNSILDRTSSPVFTAGYIAYNGVVLNMSTRSTASVRAVYSESGRQLKYLKHIFNVDAVLVADECNPNLGTYIGERTYRAYHQETTGSNMSDYRELLMQPHKMLDLKCTGLGYDILIEEAEATIFKSPLDNQVQTLQDMVPGYRAMADPASMYRVDVLYGPQPQVLDWEPVGFNKACRVNWVVEFHLARCYDEVTDIAALEWDNNWALNEAGLTTRTINGYMEVAGNLIDKDGGKRRITNFADRYRDNIPNNFPALPGFHRTQNYQQSRDRRMMTFAITDTEIDSGENAYYPGIVESDVTRSVQNGTGLTDAVYDTNTAWQMTIAGSMAVRKNVSKKLAWAAFITIVREQLSYFSGIAVQQQGVDEADGQDQRKKGEFSVLLNLSITEQLFGRGVQFSISWKFLTSLAALIESTGMFEPLDAKTKQPMQGANEPQKIHDWDLWSESMTESQSPRGWQQMRFNPDGDQILDFCQGDPVVRYIDAYRERHDEPKSQPIFNYKPPDPEYSYLHYRNAIDVEEDTKTVRQDILRKPSFEPPEFDDEARGAFAKSKGELIFAPSGSYEATEGKPAVVTHRRGESAFTVTLSGYAIRCGYAPEIPTLKTWSGVPVKLQRRKVTVTPIGRTSGATYLAQWRKTYVLERAFQGDLSKAGSKAVANAPKLIGHGLAEGIS